MIETEVINPDTVSIKTIDAVGKERTYLVGFSDTIVDGRVILEGRRIDVHQEHPSVPSRVFDIAKEELNA